MNQKAIDTIRFLGVDAINEANSGHPGIVLGAAPMASTLFTEHLTINPKQSNWINRDRFVLSAGHGSMLLYALNHLSGYQISIEDIKRFRKAGNTPGHPEYGHTDGVETTSGPLGQGISNAVGMAMAEAHLAARFNKDGYPIINHYTYVICGDGDLQEGVALEAISLAGHLGLGKLIVLFDSNDIQLDGEVKWAYSEKHKTKFESIGWQYILVEDGTDTIKINQAIKKAKKESNKPTIIEVKTEIGYGTTNARTSKVHGSPIGKNEAEQLRKKFNWTYEPFEVPQDVYAYYRKKVINRGAKAYRQWNKLFDAYQAQYPEDANLFKSFFSEEMQIDLEELQQFAVNEKDATRNVSGKVLDYLSKQNLNIIGGSADLSSSTKAKGADGHFYRNNYLARNINFGVREHAMAAIVNGMVLHKGLKVFSGAFFVFSDYMKPAVRLSAIMEIPSIFVFSHDSIAVGEDGPTHQPIEQLVGLRTIPGFNLIRPADANETIAAWKIALESQKTPTAIVLTRQDVDNQKETNYEGVLNGAYIVRSEKQKLDGILLAAGSEVGLALRAQKELQAESIDVRVVSMPSHYLFEKQSEAYKNSVLPLGVKTLAIEMGSPESWYKYTNKVYGIEKYGISAPGDYAVKTYGFTVDKIIEAFKKK